MFNVAYQASKNRIGWKIVSTKKHMNETKSHFPTTQLGNRKLWRAPEHSINSEKPGRGSDDMRRGKLLYNNVSLNPRLPASLIITFAQQFINHKPQAKGNKSIVHCLCRTGYDYLLANSLNHIHIFTVSVSQYVATAMLNKAKILCRKCRIVI
jgi:hypothetical protein